MVFFRKPKQGFQNFMSFMSFMITKNAIVNDDNFYPAAGNRSGEAIRWITKTSKETP